VIAFVDVPGYLLALDEESRGHGAALAGRLGPHLAAGAVKADQDATRADSASLVYLESGILKWQEGARLVRLYNEGDWLTAGPAGAGHGASATSEFLTGVRTIERAAFEARLRADPEAAELWQRYRDLQERILLGLAAALARENQTPDTRLVRYRPGDVIVTEGTAADEVFVMLEGGASVEVDGGVVGAIGEGEVFGEIAFLTGQPRSATVIATSPCLVQAIARAQFEVMAGANPQLMVRVASTLANRIVDLNRKLQAASSPAR
jgi:hypothetical protein